MRDLSKPLAPTFGDDDKKKKKKKKNSSVLKLTQSPNDYALVDTTGYSKGKKSFPYTWHRSSGFGLSNKKTTSNHSFTKKELDKHIKKQNPNHRTKGGGGAGASWKKKTFKQWHIKEI